MESLIWYDFVRTFLPLLNIFVRNYNHTRWERERERWVWAVLCEITDVVWGCGVCELQVCWIDWGWGQSETDGRSGDALNYAMWWWVPDLGCEFGHQGSMAVLVRRLRWSERELKRSELGEGRAVEADCWARQQRSLQRLKFVIASDVRLRAVLTSGWWEEGDVLPPEEVCH
jgi:hypothetical protein